MFEPDVALSPLDPLHVVVAVNTFRSDPLAVAHRSGLVLVSRDGGESWKATVLGDATKAPTGPLAGCPVVADLSVGFDPSGTLYVAGMAGATVGTLGLFVASSDDGAETFSRVNSPDARHPLRCGGSAGALEVDGSRVDRPWLGVGPNGTLVLTWHEIGQQVGTPIIDDRTYFVVSHDGGATWSPATAVAREGLPWAGGTIVVESADHWSMAVFDGGKTVFARTMDAGKHWDRYAFGPAANQFPDLAVGPGPNGTRHWLAYAESGSDRHRATLVWSDDGGQTWTEPLVLAENPFGPWINVAVDGAGTAFASFFTSMDETIVRVAVALVNETLVGPLRLGDATIETPGMDTSSYGHYFGIAGAPLGAFAVWGAGAPALTDARIHGASIALHDEQ